MAIVSTFPEKRGLNTDDINDIASGEISNGFVQSSSCYSTEEQVIGKWIDGKPLYQKTFEGRTPSTLNTAENFCLFNNGEIFENIIIVDGFSTDEKSTPTYTSIQGGNGNSSWSVWANPTAIRNKFNDSTRLHNKAWITIRYTKTTD